jgi:UDP-glucose 4-epimerase
VTSHLPSCIVLGGGGFLGTNLCRRLVAAGARVGAFGRRGLFQKEIEGVEWYEGDFCDPTTLTAAIKTFDTVFHLVHTTTPLSANVDIMGDLRKNVSSSLALLETSRNHRVKRIIFVSSGGTIYGLAKEIPTPESAPTDPITAYGISKLAVEKYLALYEHLYDLEFRVLRVANPFGLFQVPTKGQGIVAALISHAIANESTEIWGDGSIVRDYIFADDVIDALQAAAADQSDARIFNIGSGRGRSIRELIAAIEMQLSKKLDIRWKQRRAVDVPTSILSIDRARDILGWRPKIAFDDGLRTTIEWWKDYKIQSVGP